MSTYLCIGLGLLKMPRGLKSSYRNPGLQPGVARILQHSSFKMHSISNSHGLISKPRLKAFDGYMVRILHYYYRCQLAYRSIGVYNNFIGLFPRSTVYCRHLFLVVRAI